MLTGMANPFSSIETALNAAAVGAMGNATLIWGAVGVPVVFDAVYADPAGLSNTRPQARSLASLVTGMAPGAAVSLNGVSYTIQSIEPDGTGLVALTLRRV